MELVAFMIDERSWLESAAERRCAWPRRPAGLGGGMVGDARPLSVFVGLVLMTAMASPPLILPPTYSLPPRLWPWPFGLAGIDCGESGGLSIDESGLKTAPGLNENAGKVGDKDVEAASSSSSENPNCRSPDSMADRGRRPEALE